MEFRELGLSLEQEADLKEMVKLRQWSSLLFLFRQLDKLATEQLVGFTDQFDAYERRGYVKGLRLGLETVNSIYSQTHSGENEDGNRNTQREGPTTTSTAVVTGGLARAAAE